MDNKTQQQITTPHAKLRERPDNLHAKSLTFSLWLFPSTAGIKLPTKLLQSHDTGRLWMGYIGCFGPYL